MSSMEADCTDDGVTEKKVETKQLVLFLGGSQRKHDYVAKYFREYNITGKPIYFQSLRTRKCLANGVKFYYDKFVKKENYKIIAVCPLMDSLIPFCDELCEMCNIEYNDPTTSQWRRNKALMHGIIKQNGSKINNNGNDIEMNKSNNESDDNNNDYNNNNKGLRFGKSFELNKYPNNKTEFENQLKENNIWYPFVIKPPTSGGTDGVRLIFSYIGAKKMIEKYLFKENSELNVNNTLMIQEYLNGIEFVVNCVSYNGNHKLSDMWQSYKSLDVDCGHMTLHKLNDLLKEKRENAEKEIHESTQDRDSDNGDNNNNNNDNNDNNDNNGNATTMDDEKLTTNNTNDKHDSSNTNNNNNNNNNNNDNDTTQLCKDNIDNKEEIDLMNEKYNGKNGINFGWTFNYDYQELVHNPNENSKYLNIINYVFNILDILGVKYGASHVEVMYLPNEDETCLIELNARMHGDLPRGSAIIGYDQLSLLSMAAINSKKFMNDIPSIYTTSNNTNNNNNNNNNDNSNNSNVEYTRDSQIIAKLLNDDSLKVKQIFDINNDSKAFTVRALFLQSDKIGRIKIEEFDKTICNLNTFNTFGRSLYNAWSDWNDLKIQLSNEQIRLINREKKLKEKRKRQMEKWMTLRLREQMNDDNNDATDDTSTMNNSSSNNSKGKLNKQSSMNSEFDANESEEDSDDTGDYGMSIYNEIQNNMRRLLNYHTVEHTIDLISCPGVVILAGKLNDIENDFNKIRMCEKDEISGLYQYFDLKEDFGL